MIKNEIIDVLRNRKAIIEKETDIEKVFGVFLYGSQNYGLQDEASDIDSIAVVVPTFENVLFEAKINSFTFEDDYGECVVKDFRSWFKEFEKMGVPALETLFTPYYVCDEFYEQFYSRLAAIREKIAVYSKNRFLIGVCAVIAKYNDSLNKEWKAKTAASIFKNYGFILRYSKYFDTFEEVLIADNADFILNVKHGIVSKEEILQKIENITQFADGVFRMSVLRLKRENVDRRVLQSLHDIQIEIAQATY